MNTLLVISVYRSSVANMTFTALSVTDKERLQLYCLLNPSLLLQFSFLCYICQEVVSRYIGMLYMVDMYVS